MKTTCWETKNRGRTHNMLSAFSTSKSLFLSEKKLYLYLILCSVIFQIFLILPALIIPFGLMDDYHYIQPDGIGFFKNFQIPVQLSFARPFAAFFLGIYSGLIGSLEGLALVRFFSAFFFGVAQGWLAIFIFRVGVPTLPAFAVAAVAMAVPGVASVEMWATAGPFVPGIFFSMLAAELVFISQNLAPDLKRSRSFLYAAGCCLICSLLFYPPIGLFFSVPILSIILFSRDTISYEFKVDLLKKTVSVYAISLLVYFVAVKLIYFKLVSANASQYTFSVTNDLLSKSYKFLFELTPIAANIFTWHHPLVPIFVLSIILMGVAIDIIKKLFINPDLQSVRITLISLILLLMMTAAHLILSQDDVRASRVLISYQGALAILFSWGIWQLTKIINNTLWVPLTLSVALFSAWTAVVNITTAALNGFLELRYVQSQLKTLSPHINNIRLIKVPVGSSFIGTTRNNGFNWTTSDTVSTMLPSLVGYALEQEGNQNFYVTNAGFESRSFGRKQMSVTAIPPEQYSSEAPNSKTTLTIDLRSLLKTN